LQAAFLDQEVIKIALTSPSGAGLQRFPMAHAAAMMFDAESSLCLTLESEAVAAGATDGLIIVAAAVHILSRSIEWEEINKLLGFNLPSRVSG
jgi:hypothetical protein